MAPTFDTLSVSSFGSCPLPKGQYDRILLGHGSGGRLTADLIQQLFVPAFANDVLAALEDQATVALPQGWSQLQLTDGRQHGTARLTVPTGLSLFVDAINSSACGVD